MRKLLVICAKYVGVKFLRQRPILNFIVDFFAPEIKLAVEIDGSQHYFDQGKYQDIYSRL